MAASRTLQGQRGTRRRRGEEPAPELEVTVSHVQEGDAEALSPNALQREASMSSPPPRTLLPWQVDKDVPRRQQVPASGHEGSPETALVFQELLSAKHTHSAKPSPSRTSEEPGLPWEDAQSGSFLLPRGPQTRTALSTLNTPSSSSSQERNKLTQPAKLSSHCGLSPE